MKIIGHMRITPNYGFGSILVSTTDNGLTIYDYWTEVYKGSYTRLSFRKYGKICRRYSTPTLLHLLCNASTFIEEEYIKAIAHCPKKTNQDLKYCSSSMIIGSLFFSFCFVFWNMLVVSWVYILGRNNSLVLQLWLVDLSSWPFIRCDVFLYDEKTLDVKTVRRDFRQSSSSMESSFSLWE